MSKMACLCGGIIRDNLIPCPTEGLILRDQDQDAYYADASRDISAFFDAVRGGRREAWIVDYFSAKYSTDESDAAIIEDILSCNARAFLSVAECEQCGRLWVQRKPDINSYRSYAPDEPGYAGALRSEQREQCAEADRETTGSERLPSD